MWRRFFHLKIQRKMKNKREKMRNSLYLGVFGCCANKCLGVQTVQEYLFILPFLHFRSIEKKR